MTYSKFYSETDNLKSILLKAALKIGLRKGKQKAIRVHSQMMKMRECKQFIGNLSVCEQFSRREKAGKLEGSKNIQK